MEGSAEVPHFPPVRSLGVVLLGVLGVLRFAQVVLVAGVGWVDVGEQVEHRVDVGYGARPDPRLDTVVADLYVVVGMMLGIGYTIGAVSPFILGALRDATGSFTASLWLIAGFSALLLATVAALPGRTKDSRDETA